MTRVERIFGTTIVCLGLVLVASCRGRVSESDCAGVTCSGHGTCVMVEGAARCACDEGYRTEGLECIATGSRDGGLSDGGLDAGPDGSGDAGSVDGGSPGRVVAFPGAEGFGAESVGGRGGEVIEVTNLNDSGPGSLRAAVEEASGPRTVVFRIGGTIVLESEIYLGNPYITIAGQTAPGDGITLRASNHLKGSLINVATHDVVIRYLRFRRGPGAGPDCCGRGLSIGNPSSDENGGGYNVIIDHNSFSWGADGNTSTWYNSSNRITYQWNINAEDMVHPGTYGNSAGGPNAYCGVGEISGGKAHDISYHHNLFVSNFQRNPKVFATKRIDLINNYIYNWASQGMEVRWEPSEDPREQHTNIIGNYFKAGPDKYDERYPLVLTDVGPHLTYIHDNLGYLRPDSSYDEWSLVADNTDWTCYRCTPADPAVLAAPEPWPQAPVPITIDPAESLETTLLPYVGASKVRDEVDERIINEVMTGTGSLVDTPEDISGWPTLDPGTPPTDSDHDGMPDEWERSKGLDPSDPGDRNDLAPSGYTWLEEYLNSII